MPESYEQAWRRLDEDAERRYRQETAQRIEGITHEHDWAGGFWCQCGISIGMPMDWGRHLLEVALFEDVEPS